MAPVLIEVNVPKEPAGVVLVLHGGASRTTGVAVSPRQLSVVRMLPIARRIARENRRTLAVYRLLNSTRGWQSAPTPADDARWALDEIATRLGARLPACLVGHSLGGRAALLAAGAPGVVSVVALAPYVYPTDIPDGIEGRKILFVHGDRDRIASPERSAALAKALSRYADVEFVSVPGGTHSMLRHRSAFDARAAQFAASTLEPDPVATV